MGDLAASTEVLIAGAGPTGLTLALTLRHHGVDCVVVDPQPAAVAESRAIAVHAGSLERLHTLGVADDLIGHGVTGTVTEIRNGARVVARNDWTQLPSRFPMVCYLAQRDTEALLAKHLDASGGRAVRGWRVTDFAVDGDRVRVDAGRDGDEAQLAARFLVGCDGAHSTVRKRLGISFGGARYPETYLLADADIAGLDRDNYSAIFLQDDGFLLLASLPGGWTRMAATVPDGVEPTPDAVRTLLTQRAGQGLDFTTIAWASIFTVHRRIVDRMRAGPVLLAGDAAHIHSPAGGQGMNLGIRDAFDLGHRLAAVLHGNAPTKTLDAYNRQRRAEARRVLANTDRLSRFLTATGIKRRLADLAMTVASRAGNLSDRIMIDASGITTPWPPGTTRPRHP